MMSQGVRRFEPSRIEEHKVAKRTQWEYRWQELTSHAEKRVRTEATVTPPHQLNDLGKDGWEAVQMMPFPGTAVEDGNGRLLVLLKRSRAPADKDSAERSQARAKSVG